VIRKDSPFKNYVEIWWKGIRPRTLPAAMAGVITGSALAWLDGNFHFIRALTAMAVALLLQIGSNLTNDVSDFKRGADAGPRTGPQRVTQSGLLTPQQVKTGIVVVFCLAAILGFTFFFSVGWVIIPIGAAAIFAAIAYTAGPYPLGYHGLGEFFVFIFFGIAAVTGTYFVQVGRVSILAWLMALPIGFMIVDILVVNNLRDLDSDKIVGKLTLAARFGSRFARNEYLLFMGAAFLCFPIFCILHLLSWWSMLTWLVFPMAIQTSLVVLKKQGGALNQALAQTGKIALFTSMLFFLSILF